VLVARFEGIRKLVLGAEFEIDPQAIVESGPEALAAFIAAGMGLPGRRQGRGDRRSALPLTDQLEIVGKILEVTLPEGPKKLQARVEELLDRAGLRSTSSPAESPSSSSAVTPIRPQYTPRRLIAFVALHEDQLAARLGRPALAGPPRDARRRQGGAEGAEVAQEGNLTRCRSA
jgi:hypothetical protein